MHCVDYMKECTEAGQHFETLDVGESIEMGISQFQAKIIQGAINSKANCAHEIEKRISTVFMLNWDAVLDETLLEELTVRSFSRIPIYVGPQERYFIVGVLMLKSLVRYQLDDEPKTIGQLAIERKIEIRDPIYIHRQASLQSIMKKFKNGALHQAVVCEDPEGMQVELIALVKKIQQANLVEESQVGEEEDYETIYENLFNINTEGYKVSGIVSMENVLEYLLGMQILDEKDAMKHSKLQRKNTALSKSILHKSFLRQDSVADDAYGSAKDLAVEEDMFSDGQKMLVQGASLTRFFDNMKGKVIGRVTSDIRERSVLARKATERQAQSDGALPGLRKIRKKSG